MAFDLGISNLIQSVSNSAAGILSGIQNAKTGSTLPWIGSPSGSVFFQAIDIDTSRWNQLFPYRLLVIDTTNNNAVVGGSATQGGTQTVSQEDTGTIVSFTPFSNSWTFTLPITPQQLNITDQFAINTTATLRGILEEHNGIKFKMINVAATLGVWPYRESVTHPPASPSLVQSLFGGTISAVNNLVTQAQGVINTITTGHPANKPVTVAPELSTSGATSTGYYQAMALQQFLEQYAEAKKDPDNAGWRLVFDIPKQNQSYIVTPMQFMWQQNVNKPMEISMNMQLKAWRRINLLQAAAPVSSSVQPISPGILQTILNTIAQARATMSAAIDLIGAVRSDVDTPLDALRQTTLFVKDLAGVALSSADLPFQVVSDYKSAIAAAMVTLQTSISSNISDSVDLSNFNAIVASSANNEGLSLTAVAGGQLGLQAMNAQMNDPSNNVFTQADRNFTLLDQVPISSMQLSNAQQAEVNSIIASASQLTVADLKVFRGTILTLALQLSNSFGAGSAYYDEVYGRPAPTPRILPMQLDEYDILKSLYDSIQAYDILTSTNQIDDNQFPNNMNYVAGLADLSGIPFTVPTSKILAPVPFGLTIEGISARYLQDPQRWIEIATLNNLRDPYIDENGFQLSLLSNAIGRQVTVDDIDNLYIGQTVTIMSATQIPSARTILGITSLSDTDFLITLDGLANLDNFKIVDLAYLQVYLPGTVNSQQKIFIPSSLPLPTSPDITPPPATTSDPLTGLSKVDLLLTDSGDLAVNNYGDFRFSYGITNIMQALKIKFGTEKGKSLLHPEFGLNVRPGTSSADTDIQSIYNSVNKMIQDDPRFSGVASLQIQLNGPTLTINVAVVMAGNQGVFPLSFQLTT